MGITYLLPRIVGLGHASELLFFGDIILAPRALEIGLVNRVVADGEACLKLALRAALALRQGDATKDPSDASAQVALAGVHQIFGDLARAQKQPARALESYRAALAMLEAVQAKNASDQRVAKDVAALRRSSRPSVARAHPITCRPSLRTETSSSETEGKLERRSSA